MSIQSPRFDSTHRRRFFPWKSTDWAVSSFPKGGAPADVQRWFGDSQNWETLEPSPALIDVWPERGFHSFPETWTSLELLDIPDRLLVFEEFADIPYGCQSARSGG